MDVRVETHHASLPANNRKALNARIERFFARFAGNVRRVRITLKDINGPRGGCDKECILRAEFIDGGHVVLVDRAPRMRTALLGCLHRARALVGNEMRRRKARKRPRLDRRSSLTASAA